MPGWVPGASSKNCGGPQYSLTKGLADGFTARVLIPQWQAYAAVELSPPPPLPPWVSKRTSSSARTRRTHSTH